MGDAGSNPNTILVLWNFSAPEILQHQHLSPGCCVLAPLAPNAPVTLPTLQRALRWGLWGPVGGGGCQKEMFACLCNIS